MGTFQTRQDFSKLTQPILMEFLISLRNTTNDNFNEGYFS